MLITCLESENIKYQAIITLAVVTEIRRVELCVLRWSDINFRRDVISVTKSLEIIDGEVDEARAKTPYSIREIFINEKL